MRFCRTILNDVDLLVRLGPGISLVLKGADCKVESKAAARTILDRKDFVTLPKEIVSTALIIVASEEVAKAAARTILDSKDFVTLSYQIVSTALKIASDEVAKTAARTILDRKDFVTLPKEIVSTALKIASDEVAKTATRDILDRRDFVTLPHQIVSTALNIVASEEVAKAAALRVLDQSDQVTTFLQFAALRTLVQTTDVSARSIADNIVSRACMPPFKSKGSRRLRYDLLFLPYARVTSHRLLTEAILADYHPACPISLKENVYKILRCRIEYGPQREIHLLIIDLCNRIAQTCAEDLEHQWRVNRDKPRLGHIWTSLELLSPSHAFHNAVDTLRAYATANPKVAEWEAFQHLLARLRATDTAA